MEVAVDDEVDQAVDDRADAVLRQVAVVVPALHQPVDVEALGRPYGDQRARGDERGDLVGRQLAGVDVEVDLVDAEELVRGVAVELGPVAAGGRVLDGQRVQRQLVGDQLEVLGVRGAEVDPDDGLGVVLEVLGDLLDGEVLVGQDAVGPAAGLGRHGPSSPVASGQVNRRGVYPPQLGHPPHS